MANKIYKQTEQTRLLSQVTLADALLDHILTLRLNLTWTTATCALDDLPSHLIYEITRSLDFKSQRNLFMCSSQFYSKWQLHIPDHEDWQSLDRSINLLAKGLCDPNSHIGLLLAQKPFFVLTCQRQGFQCRKNLDLLHS